MLVGAAGIAVELFLGALALFVWLPSSPARCARIAYNVMLISGISTLLFNGNPLLRFDGYYVLADASRFPISAARTSTSATCSSATCSACAMPSLPRARPGERVWMVASSWRRSSTASSSCS